MTKNQGYKLPLLEIPLIWSLEKDQTLKDVLSKRFDHCGSIVGIPKPTVERRNQKLLRKILLFSV